MVNKEDTSPPSITPSATEGNIVSTQNPGQVVDSSGNPIELSTSDPDDNTVRKKHFIKWKIIKTFKNSFISYRNTIGIFHYVLIS